MARMGYSGRDHHLIPLERGEDHDGAMGHRPSPDCREIREGTHHMQHFRNLLQARRVDRDEAGASAVEYGLLVAGIAALIVAVVFLFGGMVKSVFSDTCT